MPNDSMWTRAKNAIIGPGTYAAAEEPNAPKTTMQAIGKAVNPFSDVYNMFAGPNANVPMVNASALKAEDSIPGNGIPSQVAKGVTQGVEEGASGLTSPKNVGLIAATGVLGPVAPLLAHATSLGFSWQMLKDAYEKMPTFRDQVNQQQYQDAARTLTGIALETGMGVLGAKHSAKLLGDAALRTEPLGAYNARQASRPLGEQNGRTAADPEVLQGKGLGTGAPPAGGAEAPPIDVNPGPQQAPPPVPPTPTEHVGPRTPVPPTAAQPTTPETPETLDTQLAQMGQGLRKVVMVPKSNLDQGYQPAAPLPAGVSLTADAYGNRYYFDKQQGMTAEQVRSAAKNNKLPEILGGPVGMQAPDKSVIPPGQATVVKATAPNGTEVQSTATVPQMVPETLAATQPLVPPGGRLDVVSPQAAIQDRTGAPVPPPVSLSAPPSLPAQGESSVEEDLRRTQQGGPVGLLPQRNTGPSVPESDLDMLQRGVTPPAATEAKPGQEIFRGAWNVPLNQNGIADAQDAAKRTAGQFTEIHASPLGRAQQTAAEVAKTNPQAGPVQTEPALAPWTLGGHEGQPVTPERIKDMNDHIANRPDEPMEGIGIKSGKPAQSFNEFKNPLLQHVVNQVANFEPGQRILNVTHYRDIRALDAWLKAGGLPDLSIDTDAMTTKGKEKPGQMFRLDPETGKLSLAKDATKDGVYFLRHGETEANEGAKNVSNPTQDSTGTLVPRQANAADSTGSKQNGDSVFPVDSPAEPHKFSSTQVNLPSQYHAAFQRAAASIPDAELAADGREAEPHITVKYGLHAGEPSGTVAALSGEGPITAKIGKVSIFKGDDADVVKLDVNSPDLHRLNKKIATQPHTDTYPIYQPHITLAYVKPGEGAKYVGRSVPGLTGETVPFDSVTFSAKDRTQTPIPLRPGLAAPEPVGGGEPRQMARSPWEIQRQNASVFRLPAAHVATYEPIPLTGADTDRAIALRTNAAGMIYAFNQEPQGLAFPPDTAMRLTEMIQEDIDKVGESRALRAMLQLQNAAYKASLEGKMLVLVNEGNEFDKLSPAQMDQTLRHELDHALQNSIEPHEAIWTQRYSPLFIRAANALRKFAPLDYGKMSDPALRDEIGVRLMQPGHYQDMGLSIAEARALAAEYIRGLRRQYGNLPPKEIAERIFTALDRAAQPASEATPTTNVDSLRSAGGERTPESARSDLPIAASARPDTSPRLSASPESSGNSPVKKNSIQQFMESEAGTFTPQEATARIRELFDSELFDNWVMDPLRKTVAPQTRGDVARYGAGTLRNMEGIRMRRQAMAKAAFEQFRDYFNRQPISYQVNSPGKNGMHGLDVVDAIEGGKAQIAKLDPVGQQFANLLRPEYEKRKTELQSRGILNTFLDDYFTHAWKERGSKTAPINTRAKKPLAGGEEFRKQRTYTTISDGMNDPNFTLVPRYDNPVDFLLHGLSEMDRSITAHDTFNEWKSAGMLPFYRSPKDVPDGYAPINDKIFTVFGPKKGAVKVPADAIHSGAAPTATLGAPVSPDEITVYGKREMGKFYAPAELAKVANNFLSDGLQATDIAPIFNAWMKIKGAMNMLNLGFSGFHGMTTTLNSSLSDLALGMMQARQGQFADAAKSLGMFSTVGGSVVRDMIRGKALESAYNGQSNDPVANAAMQDLEMAGGSPYQAMWDPDLLYKSMKKSWDEGSKGIAIAKALNPLLWSEQFPITKFIMTKMVPRVKIAAFERAMSFEVGAHPGMGFDEMRERAARIWDSMDDRFGQLNQKNMFMHNIVKDTINATVGRFGWTQGTLRQAFGGLGDLAHGQLSHRAATLIASIVGAAIINGVANVIMTGTMPKGKDFIMPRTGGFDESGNPARAVLPLYLVKDYYSWATRPLATAKAKLTPALMGLGDLAENRNFRRQKIYGKGGIGWNYLTDLFAPYALTGATQNLERGQSPLKTALPFMGIMPASKYASMSKAEKIVTDYMDEHAPEVRSGPTARSVARQQLLLAVKQGDMAKAQQIGRDSVTAGKLSPSDVTHAIQSATSNPLQAMLKRSDVPVSVALEAYDAATPAQKQQIKDIVKGKVYRSLGKPWEWEDDGDRALVQKLFGIRPPAKSLGTPTAVGAQ